MNERKQNTREAKVRISKAPKPPVIEFEVYPFLATLTYVRPHMERLAAELRTGKVAKENFSEHFSNVSRLVSFINDVLPPERISEVDVDAGNFIAKIR